MNRRAFLASLAAGFALDPERLLWSPRQKLISAPRPPASTWIVDIQNSHLLTVLRNGVSLTEGFGYTFNDGVVKIPALDRNDYIEVHHRTWSTDFVEVAW